jgi:molybdopterin-guanine dinucleotide biosynthesis protein MobB
LKTVVFFGYSNGGKTRAITGVAKELVNEGMKVGTMKHIHDKDFTIDTKGKDTWRHAAAGASVVVALAPNELTTIEKEDTRAMTIDELLYIFKSRHVDYLLIEGLYRKLSRRRNVVRVFCTRSLDEAADLLRKHPKPICILNVRPHRATHFQGVLLLRLPRDIRRLRKLIG